MEISASFLKDIMKTSGDIWSKGWAERNAGNISVRLNKEEVLEAGTLNSASTWVRLNKPIPELGGEYFLISGTGKYIRNIALEPQKNLGIIQLDSKGEMYRLVWGYKDVGSPTSELYAHLQAHAVRKNVTAGTDRAIIHTHPANIIALTYGLDLDTPSLSRLLWEMHAECIVVFPEGVEFLPWMMAGSGKIADETAKAFEKRNMVVWQYHGIFAVGRDLDSAFGLIDAAEKAAEIYIKVASMGGVKQKLSLKQLDSIARNFGFVPDEEIMKNLDK